MTDYQQIKDLQMQTLEDLRNPRNFGKFLKTTAYLHRYSFDEQVLIYAQNPHVTAVATAEVWQRPDVRRRVKDDAQAIAMINGDGLKYLYDVSDTELLDPDLKDNALFWDFPKNDKEIIFKALEREYGKGWIDYGNQARFMWEMICKFTDNGDEQCAIAITTLHRMGYPDEFIFHQGQENVMMSVDEVVKLGISNAKISRQLLDSIRRESKIFAEQKKAFYNQITGGGQDVKIHESRQLPSAKPTAQRGTAEDIRQVGANAPRVLAETQGSPIHPTENEGRIDKPPQRSGQTGEGTLGNPDEPVGEQEPIAATGDDRMGRVAEQPTQPSGRSGDESTDTGSVNTDEVEVIKTPLFVCPKKQPLDQISFLFGDEVEQAVEDDPLFPEHAITEIMRYGTLMQGGKCRIYEQYDRRLSSGKEFQNFLKNEYANGGTTHAYREKDSDFHIGMSCHQPAKGIILNNGDVERILTWSEVGKRILALCQEGSYMREKDMKKYAEYLAEKDGKTLAEAQAELLPSTPVPVFIENDDDVKNMDLSEYEDRDVIGYNKKGVKFSVAKSDGATFIMTETAITSWGEVLGYNGDIPENILSQIRIANGYETPELPYTPLFKSYYEFKNQLNEGVILLYHLGDFYEAFDDDAHKVANILDITITGRDNGVERIPMCGFPDFALEKHADTLTKRGLEVAIVEGGENGERSLRMHGANTEPVLEVAAENYIITDDNLGIGGPNEKYRKNVNALKVLKTLEQEKRPATPHEMETLSNYVGWGSLAQAFDEKKADWADRNAELKELLSYEEYKAAKASTTDSFYTSPTIIKSVYKALEHLGFEGGNILEPSCGVGNFFGLLPENMADSKLYGVELDSVTGQIAKQLYPNADIKITGFENTDFPDGFFDVVVGNVPFGQFGVNDPRYNKHNFHIHDYFFAKSLDKVRSGGVVAFITSKWTMDKQNTAVRKYIAQRAELLGAIRLPNTAFKDNAGTETTTDIIFLQKREKIMDVEPDWVHVSQVEDSGIPVNSYFAENPHMVLGTMAWDERMNNKYGTDNATTCLPIEGAELQYLLEAAIPHIKGEIQEAEFKEIDGEEQTNTLPADPTLRNFSFTVVNDEIYYQTTNSMEKRTFRDTAKERIKGMIAIRDCVREVIALQMNDCTDEELSAKQEVLNNLYDKFTKKWGLLNSRENKRLFAEDNSSAILIALEIIEDGKLESKSDMFSKRTIRQHAKVEHVNTAVEALGVSLGERAGVDLDFMQSLSGIPEEKLLEDLHGVVFQVPKDGEIVYQTADEYLSGNVREKLVKAKEYAENNPDYAINVAALEKVIPEDIPASEIDVRLGATWFPIDDYKDFINELLDVPSHQRDNLIVDYSPQLVQWHIGGRVDKYTVLATSRYGTDRVNAYKIIENTLNLKTMRVFDYVWEDGKQKPVLNRQETAIACEKQEIIKQAFRDWIWKDPDRRARLTRYYNDHYNNIRPRDYDGSHLQFVGMNPEITLEKHQIDAVARTIYGGNTLLAHCVGAGKTYEMVASAMESKRLGLCTKSMIVVPNHLTEQWASEFLALYPSANVLITRKEDFETQKRKQFCARIATGDYDAVIIGHSQFGKLPISKERMTKQIDEQINDIVLAIDEAKNSQGANWAVKQMEAMKKRLEVRLEKLNDQTKKDNVLTFEELGIDKLFIDESDEFKNLFFYTKMTNVAGVAQVDAQKSADLYGKCQYLDEITDGRGIVFATGTPIANSMCELYTVQRYLQREELRRRGLPYFDDWSSTFGETVSAIELAPEGTGYRMKTRFSHFYNIPELMSMFKECADIKTADMLNLPVPKANYHNVAVPASELQKEMVKDLASRADDVRKRRVKPHEDNMLKITNDGRKLALDQRLINPLLGDYEGSKVNACVQNVFEIWEQTTDERKTQLVFCDLSTPKDDTFNVYDDIKGKLIDMGIPQEEVAFIHEANTDIRKKELFAKVRAGRVRVLIGSTSKMGAGTNVQTRLYAIHHLDCPWRPRDLEQRDGRIVRQGNENEEVHIYRYVTENTFDSYLYQIIENKQRFISQIMTSKNPVRKAEDLDEATLNYAEVKALATGDPYIKEKMELDMEVSRLKMLKSAYQSKRYDLEDFILRGYPKEKAYTTDMIKGMKIDLETYRKNNKEEFVGMTVKGVFYEERVKAGEALLGEIKGMTTSAEKDVGEYLGFEVRVKFDTFDKKFSAILQGEVAYTVELGADPSGNITRINNALSHIEEKITQFEEALVKLEKDFEESKVELEQPFEHVQELAQKSERLMELNALISVDAKENEADLIEDEEPDELPKAAGMER